MIAIECLDKKNNMCAIYDRNLALNLYILHLIIHFIFVFFILFFLSLTEKFHVFQRVNMIASYKLWQVASC